MISIDTIRDIREGSTIQVTIHALFYPKGNAFFTYFLLSLSKQFLDTRIVAAEESRKKEAGIQVTVLSDEDMTAKTTPGNEGGAFELQTENGFICSTHRSRVSNIHKLPGSALSFEVAEITKK